MSVLKLNYAEQFKLFKTCIAVYAVNMSGKGKDTEFGVYEGMYCVYTYNCVNDNLS